jgi:hypothetical protein
MPFDQRSERNLATLVPRAEAQARAFLQAVLDAGIRARIIDGSRTFAKQDALFAQGRTRPGRRVTNARGGFSNHNFGIAWDIGIFSSSGAYVPESPDYRRAGQIGRGLGLEWGGDWAGLVDEPHFQCKSSKSIGEMRAIVLANGGDINKPAAIAAIDALVLGGPSSGGTLTPVTPPGTPEERQPVEVYFNTRLFDIDAYLKESRTWVSADDFTDYFGGVVARTSNAPVKVVIELEGQETTLGGEIHNQRFFVKFADINTIFGYAFRFDSARKRLTLSR